MDEPIIQFREFYDGTWSIMARIYNPSKKFYEHPTLIGLTKEEADKYYKEYINNKPSVDEIINNWVYIGN